MNYLNNNEKDYLKKEITSLKKKQRNIVKGINRQHNEITHHDFERIDQACLHCDVKF